MSSKQPTEKPRSVRGLIDLQRRLMRSKNPFLRRIATLLAAGALDRHLAGLTDRQVKAKMMHQTSHCVAFFELAVSQINDLSTYLELSV
jgi:hypothetical protein